VKRYLVEVTLDDGSRIDVQLDQSFHVVDMKAHSADRNGEGTTG
jgi:hypothetical protein